MTSLKARNDAIERFIRAISGRALHRAYEMTGNMEDARELVQEAEFRLVKAWDQWDRKRSLEAWFMTILRNACLDWLRRAERRLGVSLDQGRMDDARTFDETLIGPDMLPEDSLGRAELGQRVRAALACLAEPSRRTIALCDIEGMTHRQAAKALSIRPGTVASRLSRARQTLRAELGHGLV